MNGKMGSIVLCLGDLPPRLTKRELKQHVLDAVEEVRDYRLRVRPTVTDCTILRLTDQQTGETLHQGLVSIQPGRLALSAMEKLRTTPLRGVNVRVCRYRHGSFHAVSSDEFKTIGDLLGVRRDSQRKPLHMELVSNTGPAVAPVTSRRHSSRGAFAH